MKILFISTEVWSKYNPEGIVAKKILDGFINAGYEVDVITTRDLITDNKFKVKVINPLLPELFEKALKIAIGLEKPIFIIKSIKYLHNCDINQYEIIITRSEPISIHLVGLGLKGFNGSLISMFSDVGFLNPYYGSGSYLKRNVSKFIEKAVIKKYEYITHTNHRVIEAYSKFGFDSNKFRVFPNPLETLPTSQKLNNTSSLKTINLAYTGSLYGKRNPSFLFKYLADQRDDFRLYLVGAVRNMYYEENRLGKVGDKLKHKELKDLESLIRVHDLSDKVEILPFMSKKELNQFINDNVDILVNIDAESDINLFLSSKVVDYLQYSLPILNVSSEGATVDFLQSVGITRYLDYKDKSLFKISDLINDPAFKPDPALVKQYESKELCKELVRELL